MIKTLTHQYENWRHAHWEDFLYILSMNTVLLRKEAMHQTSLMYTASLQWPILFFAYGNLGFEGALIHCLFPQKGSIPVQNQPLSLSFFPAMFHILSFWRCEWRICSNPRYSWVTYFILSNICNFSQLVLSILSTHPLFALSIFVTLSIFRCLIKLLSSSRPLLSINFLRYRLTL